jgi:hypothetical protein
MYAANGGGSMLAMTADEKAKCSALNGIKHYPNSNLLLISS